MEMLMGLSQGLMHASEQHGFEGEGFSYLKSPIWWGGVVTRMKSLIGLAWQAEC